LGIEEINLIQFDLKVEIACSNWKEEDSVLNIQRSFYKFVHEKIGLGANVYVNFLSPIGEKIQERIREKVSGYWKWIDLYWLKIGAGIQSINLVQINCCSLIANDRYQVEIIRLHDRIQKELNVNTIKLLNFSADLNNPVDTGNVLIPRYAGARWLPEAAGDTVNVLGIDYNIYIWRERVIS